MCSSTLRDASPDMAQKPQGSSRKGRRQPAERPCERDRLQVPQGAWQQLYFPSAPEATVIPKGTELGCQSTSSGFFFVCLFFVVVETTLIGTMVINFC